MRLFRLFIIFSLLCGAFTVNGQQGNELKQPRILILLDGSSSMSQPWANNDPRFKVAGSIVSALMDSIYLVNDQVEFGLRVYGHQFPAQENICTDTRREVPFSKDNRTQMNLRLASLHPYGVSPIAFSLKQAAEYDLVDEVRNAYSIILITDGGESCNGKICDVVQELLQKKIFFKPYILGLVDYAPLKSQYECLGSFLQVTSEKDITPAINTIVEAYRNMLQLPNMISKLTVPTVITPRVTKVTKPIEISTPRKDTPVVVQQPIIKPPVVTQPPVVKKDTPKLVQQPVIKKDTPVVVKPSLIKVTQSSPVVLDKVDVPFVSVMQSHRQFPLFYITPPPKRLPLPKFVFITTADPAPVVPDKPKPPADAVAMPTKTVTPVATTAPKITPKVDKPKDPTFTTETEDNSETTVEIFFTDGKGVFYRSQPELEMLNHTTGKPVMQFYRTVTTAGNPEPKKMAAGTYDIRYPGKPKAFVTNIVVVDKKKNKIIVKVPNGSLKFAYEGNPNRPVAEFKARVRRLFDDPLPTVEQRCSDELYYPPGNYHLEINTLPPTVLNTDLDFGSETEVRIAEPGFILFTNTNAMKNISLYAQDGDRLTRFLGFELTGNPEKQKLQLKPGLYEARYNKTSNSPYAKETAQKFLIRSNQITEVELQ
jgi:hypothetical protein